jgi:hypothetical protein
VSKLAAVVYEGQADFIIATELADRVFLREIEWLDESLLDSQRRWCDCAPDGTPLQWRAIPKRARELGIRVHGHFDGQPALPDAQATRRAIAFVLYQFNTVDVVVLIRDMDDQSERRNGIDQARVVFSLDSQIVVGVAIPEVETWIISGFEPEDENEQASLESETQKLGKSPNTYSHELTACKNDTALRSPKRVLSVLTHGNWERHRKCWRETPLNVLESRGESNGLKDYLDEVKQQLVPLISGRNQRRQKG